ncbi:MAG: hypothetical protein AB7E31_13085 [Desulfitobacterium sp.]
MDGEKRPKTIFVFFSSLLVALFGAAAHSGDIYRFYQSLIWKSISFLESIFSSFTRWGFPSGNFVIVPLECGSCQHSFLISINLLLNTVPFTQFTLPHTSPSYSKEQLNIHVLEI